MTTFVSLGIGSMAEAIIAGIVKRGTIAPENIAVTNRSNEERLARITSTYGVRSLKDDPAELERADLVLFAMKPNDIDTALEGWARQISKEAVIISVLAGVPNDVFERAFPENPIARIMPNTSAMVGASATGISWNGKETPEQRDIVHSMLEAIGTYVEVTEEQLHNVTSLSGSGPAFFYYFVEALERANVNKGMSPEVARQLAVQTIKGAALMLEATGEEPATLRENVTSPGGTTAEGLRALKEGGLEEAVEACVEATYRRSVELGQRND